MSEKKFFNKNKFLAMAICGIILFRVISVSAQEQKINLAVAEFEARNVSQMDAVTISDFLRTELVKTAVFNVVDRSNMQKILAEQRFQMTGCTNQECAVQMGKILNVQKIVIGSLAKMVGIYYITANIIDVETGQITLSERVECPVETELLSAVEKMSHLLEARILGKTVTSPVERKVDLTRAGTFISRVIDEKTVAINRGFFDGVKKHDLYSIWEVEENTTQKIGRIMVSSVGNNESVSSLIKIKENKIVKVGYPVIYDNVRRRIFGIGARLISGILVEDLSPVSMHSGCYGTGLSYDYITLRNFGFSVESQFFGTPINEKSGFSSSPHYYWFADLHVSYPLLLLAKYHFNYDQFFSPCLGLGLSWAYFRWEYWGRDCQEKDTGNRISPVFHLSADFFSTSLLHFNISLEYILAGKFHDLVFNTLSLSTGLSLNW